MQNSLSFDDTDLYLLDGSNRIIMVGDVARYPFLKEAYIKSYKNIFN